MREQRRLWKQMLWRLREPEQAKGGQVRLRRLRRPSVMEGMREDEEVKGG